MIHRSANPVLARESTDDMVATNPILRLITKEVVPRWKRIYYFVSKRGS